jgi:hypothetical protein
MVNDRVCVMNGRGYKLAWLLVLGTRQLVAAFREVFLAFLALDGPDGSCAVQYHDRGIM